MAENTQEYCKRLRAGLSRKTFSGEASGRWYPKGDDKGYYRMEYTPRQMVLRHKSPHGPEEERIEVVYEGVNNYAIASIHYFLDDQPGQSYPSSMEVGRFLATNEGLRFLVVYLCKDPRAVFFAGNTVHAITPTLDCDEAFCVTLSEQELPSTIAITIKAECHFKAGALVLMRLRNFIATLEIYSQNMDVEFQYQ